MNRSLQDSRKQDKNMQNIVGKYDYITSLLIKTNKIGTCINLFYLIQRSLVTHYNKDPVVKSSWWKTNINLCSFRLKITTVHCVSSDPLNNINTTFDFRSVFHSNETLLSSVSRSLKKVRRSQAQIGLTRVSRSLFKQTVIWRVTGSSTTSEVTTSCLMASVSLSVDERRLSVAFVLVLVETRQIWDNSACYLPKTQEHSDDLRQRKRERQTSLNYQRTDCSISSLSFFEFIHSCLIHCWSFLATWYFSLREKTQ